MIYVMCSLFDEEEQTGLELRDFGARDIVEHLKSAEQKGVLASCCVAADAPLLEAFGERYGVRISIPGDTTSPELRSPEDAIVVVRRDTRYPMGKKGLATAPFDIRLFTISAAQRVEEGK